MKKKSFIIAALIIGMIACIASCKKKTVDPTPEPTPEPTEYVCTHDSLVYVAAVEPTGEENGCIEHYRCPSCFAEFADAQGTIPVENTILWATDYLIDDEGLCENTLVDYNSDECYFYQSLLNSYAGVGDDGSLWPDYTNWQNWNEEQWKAFSNCVYEYYKECGGENEFSNVGPFIPAAMSFGKFLASIICKDFAKNIGKSIAAFFFQDQDGNVDYKRIDEKLDKIMKGVNKIEDDVFKLTRMLEGTIYKPKMQARQEKLRDLYFDTDGQFYEIIEIIKKHGVGYNSLPASAKEEIKKISEKWYGDGTNERKLDNLLTFAQYDFSVGNMPKLYDKIAYISYPWEHQGYTFREMVRASDVAVIAQCYAMELFYYNTHGGAPQGEHSKFTKINQGMAGYAKVLEINPVIRHNDYLLCQIPITNSGERDAKFDKDLLKLEVWKYICDNENTDKVSLENHESVIKFMEYLNPNGFMSDKWFTTVSQYYKVRDEKDFNAVLKKIGFNVPVDSPKIIAGNNDKYQQVTYDNDKYCYEHAIFRYRSGRWDFDKDWLDIRTLVKNDLTGIDKIQVGNYMNIANDNKIIEKKGTNYSHVDLYYSLKKYKK